MKLTLALVSKRTYEGMSVQRVETKLGLVTRAGFQRMAANIGFGANKLEE